MGNFYYASNYKNMIINLLIQNQNLIKLINPKPSECPKISTEDVLIGGEWFINGKRYKEQGHIFDYNFVDDTITAQKTFIFVETDIDNIRQNLFTDFNLYVYIFTAKSLVRITDDTVPSLMDIEEMGYDLSYYGNRVDILCDIVDSILNENEKIMGIGTIKPAKRNYVSIYSPNNNYYGKRLKYNITNLNEVWNNCK